jgi:transcriptional regulator with XRE-family HTH domain
VTEDQAKTIHALEYQVLVESLRGARQRAKLTQEDLASRLGVDQSYVSKYERSERRLDVIELRAICQALNLEFLTFIGEFEDALRERSQ